MPPQHVEIQETLLALKRALRREREAPSDQPISSATNRGNKLKRGAKYVHAGTLPYRYGSNNYKERIEHAGYQRYILNRNPRRYNEYGDELDESESDEDADAVADDENPYGDIRLEEILRPLTHPADLATHSTLSLPYLDPALPEMVQSTEAQLRKERANLWRAKNLHRHFIGDESWMPCEKVEALDDWDLFGPHESNESTGSSKKRKRDSNQQVSMAGVQRRDYVESETIEVITTNGVGLVNGDADGRDSSATKYRPNPEESMKENGVVSETTLTNDTSSDTLNNVEMLEVENSEINGLHGKQQDSDQPLDQDKAEDPEAQSSKKSITDDKQGNDDTIAEDEIQVNGNNSSQTPPPPTRRITRALAAADNTSNAPTPPLSPTPSTLSSLSTSYFQPASLFLLPASLMLSHSTHLASNLPLHVAHSGLPLDELLETRRLLGMYIQKQEETIRGLEGVLGRLIKAKRMRHRLWEWCKAEGHVGEWSDGEDWVDHEAWGLGREELRKGRDEEDQEVQEEGRKGKRRRGREQ